MQVGVVQIGVDIELMKISEGESELSWNQDWKGRVDCGIEVMSGKLFFGGLELGQAGSS